MLLQLRDYFNGHWQKSSFEQIRPFSVSKRLKYELLIGVLISFFITSMLLNLSKLDKLYSVTLQPKHKPFLSSTIYSQNDSAVAKFLYDDVKILCMVLTNPKKQKSRAKAVKETWGRRCNKIIFLSTVLDESIQEIVSLPVTEHYDALWDKVRKGFQYVYTQYFFEYDWFMKADDDTFVVMENLRLFLYQYQTSLPLFFGYKLRYPNDSSYFSGGAGYVLSKEAIHRLVTKGFSDSSVCSSSNFGAEDLEIGKCLFNLGVLAGDSRDGSEKGNFFPFPIEEHIVGTPLGWFKTASVYAPISGLDCCSRTAISFHYIEANQMYFYEYLLYQAQVAGVSKISSILPNKFTAREILQKNDFNATLYEVF